MWDFPAARLRERPDALQRRAPGDLCPSEVQLEDRRDAAGSFSHAERWVTLLNEGLFFSFLFFKTINYLFIQPGLKEQ